jgi:hypothetical protein
LHGRVSFYKDFVGCVAFQVSTYIKLERELGLMMLVTLRGGINSTISD